ncbi:MAG: methyltransferase domain-containing protein [Candidatus Electryonea clarkiae]|nr:methyltransferase domain-containing protein [Candidatus Electryonea clarkiae]MDP8286083.1 methyltransferase domain-containing protein [Candidatus Electryonea clarkiae]
MKTNNRWQRAQKYERKWWSNAENEFDFEYLEYYAGELVKDLDGIIDINENTRTLEVGSGPAGIITHLPGNLRCAIDPLESYFAGIPLFRESRDENVEYFTAQGESLPFDKDTFNLVIMDNVLDHCQNPEKVMNEVIRVMRTNGILYLRQHVFSAWGIQLRKTIERFEIDQGHPYSFKKSTLKDLFAASNLKTISVNRSGFFTHWRYDLLSGTLKGLAKALCLVNWDTVLYVLRK